MKDSIRISCKRTLTRFCVFLITILMASTLVCTVCADNIPVLKNVDIRLGDTIGLLFHTSIPFDSNVGTVKASINDRDIDTKHVTKYNNDNCCTFLVTGIYPHEISQKITLSLSGLNLQFQTSVKEELKKMLNNSASEDEKRFASDLLQYGEATWQYREHVNGTNRPCDITTNVDGYAPSSDPISTSLINIGNSTSVVHISSIGIAYSDTNHYVIEVEVPQAMQAGAKIDIVFTRHSQVIAEESKTHEGGTQKYSFTSPALEAHKIATESLGVELKVNGTPVQTIENYGLNNFIAQLSEIGSTSDQGTALQYAKALYYYGKSAEKVYNDKRVFAQYIDTSAMQNPRFINDEGKIVFKCDNAKMHVYHYDGTESDIIDIAWTVQNTPPDYHNFYDIAVTGTAKIPSTDQTVVATTKKIRVENTVTFTPSSTIFVETHNNGTLTLPAGTGEVTPAIGPSFKVEWAENTLRTTLEVANAKTVAGMQQLSLSHSFLDKNNEEVVVDIPFVYCNTIKSIEVTSMHATATWQKSDDGNFISFQPKSIRVFFDNGAQQDYTDIEAGWNVNAKTEDVKYASSISAESPSYEFNGQSPLPPVVFATVYGTLETDGRCPIQENTYKIHGVTQLTNKVVSINLYEATMIYTGTSSCDVKIKFSLTLESGAEVQLQENKTATFDYVIGGKVVISDDTSDVVDWYISRNTWTLVMSVTDGVNDYISKRTPITPVDPIISVEPVQASPTIHIFAKDKETTKIPVSLSVKITRASGKQEFTDLTTNVENICNGDSKKIHNNVQFKSGTHSTTATVVIWNPITTFNDTITVDAISHEKDTISIPTTSIGITRYNGFKTTTSINITAPNIKDETLSAERFISYDEYQGECHLTAYKVPRITVIVSNSVVEITPVNNPTAITLNKNQSAYEIPVYLVCKNGQQSGSAIATVTHDAVMSALGNAAWENNIAQCTITCSYDGKSADAILSVTRAGGTIGSIACGTVTLPSSANGIDVTVNFTVSYDTGSSVECQNTFRIYPSGTTTAGTKTTKTSGSVTVKLSYGDVTENCTISWINPVKSIEIIDAPDNITLTNGNAVAPTGGKIKVTLYNGAQKEVTPTWSKVNYDGTALEATQTVYPICNGTEYTNKSVSITVYNPIKKVDFTVDTLEYTFQGNPDIAIPSTFTATLANGQTRSINATSASIVSTTNCNGNTVHGKVEISNTGTTIKLTYKGLNTKLQVNVKYQYEGYEATKTYTLCNPPAARHDDGGSGINQLEIPAGPYEDETITVTTALFNFYDFKLTLSNGQQDDINLSNFTRTVTNVQNESPVARTTITISGTLSTGEFLSPIEVGVAVRNPQAEYTYAPYIVDFPEDTKIHVSSNTAFGDLLNQMQVYARLYTNYSNGYQDPFAEPLIMGAGTDYQICRAECECTPWCDTHAGLDWQLYYADSTKTPSEFGLLPYQISSGAIKSVGNLWIDFITAIDSSYYFFSLKMPDNDSTDNGDDLLGYRPYIQYTILGQKQSTRFYADLAYVGADNTTSYTMFVPGWHLKDNLIINYNS